MITLRLALIALAGWVGLALADEAEPGRTAVVLQPAAVAALPASPEKIRKDEVATAPAPGSPSSGYVDDEFRQDEGGALRQWWLRYGQTLGRAE